MIINTNKYETYEQIAKRVGLSIEKLKKLDAQPTLAFTLDGIKYYEPGFVPREPNYGRMREQLSIMHEYADRITVRCNKINDICVKELPDEELAEAIKECQTTFDRIFRAAHSARKDW